MAAKYNNDEMIDLLKRISEGDEEAMTELIKKLGPKFRGYSVSKGINLNDLDEFIHELNIAIWESASSFQGKSKVTTFLFSILNNKCCTYFEKNGALKRSMIDYVDPSDILEGKYENGGVRDRNELDEKPDEKLESEDHYNYQRHRLLNKRLFGKMCG